MNNNISFMKMKLMEEFEEGNAFTRALAKTKKGGEFKIGGKTVKDTSNYDNPSVKEEMLCKECGGMVYEGACSQCGYVQESTLYGSDSVVDDGNPTDGAETAVGGVGEGMDHEVSMAKSSLQDIVSNASQLMNKIGDEEIDIPAWIQDHITNAANYIAQANTGYHEYGTGGEETPDDESSLTTMMEAILREAEKGPFFVKVAVRDAKKARDIVNDSPLYRKSVNMAASDVFYFGDEETAYDFMMDCGASGVEVTSDNVHEINDDNINEKKKPSAGLDKMGYTKNAQAAGPYRGGIGMGAGLEEKKPSAGLSKTQKSAIVKKAHKGGDIGKKGKGFADIEKAAKAGGAKDPKAVAAAAMWKNIKR